MIDPKLNSYLHNLIETVRADAREAAAAGSRRDFSVIIKKLEEIHTESEEALLGPMASGADDPLPNLSKADLLTFDASRMSLDAIASVMASAAQTCETRGGDPLLEVLVGVLRDHLTWKMLTGPVISHPENFR